MPKASDKADATETPISAPWRGAGFTKDNKPYPGVDPKTGERKSVTREGLQKEFGPKRGAELYDEIAIAGGHGRVEGFPALLLVDLDAEHDAKVKELLAEAEKKDAE